MKTNAPHTPAARRFAQPERNVPAEPWLADGAFRRFNTDDTGETFVITELEPTGRYPLNWTDGASTREGAWHRAQAQPNPVVFVGLNGERRNLGVQYTVEAAIDAAYAQYVSEGIADTDGYFGPISREAFDRGHEAEAIREALAV